MLIIVPKFTNKKLDELSSECGVIIDPEYEIVTSREIEFLIDNLIDEMIRIVGRTDPALVVKEMESWKSNK